MTIFYENNISPDGAFQVPGIFIDDQKWQNNSKIWQSIRGISRPKGKPAISFEVITYDQLPNRQTKFYAFDF